jgi:hypothetical protein
MSENGAEPGGELLISICNVPFDPRPSCLLRMNTTTYGVEPVDVGFSHPLVISGVGLCGDENFIFHVSLALPDITTPPPAPGRPTDLVTQLSVLDKRDLTMVSIQSLPEINDCHSIVRYEDMLYVVSTGTDEIFSYRLHGSEATDPRLVWSPSGASQDLHHVNSIAIADGEVVCSAFGPKGGDTWATSTHGYIHNVSSDRRILDGLHQPHTVTWSPDGFYFCNSRLGTVNLGDNVIAHLAGYARGLAFAPDGVMYAATSVGRRPVENSSRTDVFRHPEDPGELNGRCAVVRFSPEGFRTEIGLSSAGYEIYDLLYLN